MSYAGRPLPSHLRHPSMSNAGNNSNSQSSVLQARISEKKVELENLKELRDLSGQLAGQMQQLEQKLSTLANGTEAVAAVLSNWHNVLRAITMASMKIPKPKEYLPDGQADAIETEVPLPQTLVRIPVQEVQDAAKAGQATET